MKNNIYFFSFSDVAGALRAPDLETAVRVLHESYPHRDESKLRRDLTELDPEGPPGILVEITA